MQDDIRDTRDRQEKPEPRATDPYVGPDHQLPPPRRSTGVRILVWVIILALFGLLFWWVMHRKQAPAAAGGGRRGAQGGTVTLNVRTAKKGNIGVYLDAIGTVTPVYTTTLISQVTGVLTQVNYREGQLVQPRPAPDPDRSPAVPGQRAHRPGNPGPRHQPAGPGRNGPQTLPGCLGAQCHPETDPGRPGKDRPAGPGHGQIGPGNPAVRPGATGLTPTSPRPLPAASVFAWSIRATWPRPPAPRRWPWSPSCSPSPWSSPSRKTT